MMVDPSSTTTSLPFKKNKFKRGASAVIAMKAKIINKSEAIIPESQVEEAEEQHVGILSPHNVTKPIKVFVPRSLTAETAGVALKTGAKVKAITYSTASKAHHSSFNPSPSSLLAVIPTNVTARDSKQGNDSKKNDVDIFQRIMMDREQLDAWQKMVSKQEEAALSITSQEEQLAMNKIRMEEEEEEENIKQQELAAQMEIDDAALKQKEVVKDEMSRLLKHEHSLEELKSTRDEEERQRRSEHDRRDMLHRRREDFYQQNLAELTELAQLLSLHHHAMLDERRTVLERRFSLDQALRDFSAHSSYTPPPPPAYEGTAHGTQQGVIHQLRNDRYQDVPEIDQEVDHDMFLQSNAPTLVASSSSVYSSGGGGRGRSTALPQQMQHLNYTAPLDGDFMEHAKKMRPPAAFAAPQEQARSRRMTGFGTGVRHNGFHFS